MVTSCCRQRQAAKESSAVEDERILVTHNTDDFRWVGEINLLDPLAERT